MAHNLTRYNIESHASLRSHLLLNTPDAVPPIDELEAVHAELRALKQKSLERARKAEGDLRVLEGAIKKVRDLERGKAKAHSKVKRESSCTLYIYIIVCLLDLTMLHVHPLYAMHP